MRPLHPVVREVLKAALVAIATKAAGHVADKILAPRPDPGTARTTKRRKARR